MSFFISVAEAKNILHQNVSLGNMITIPLEKSLGMYLAEDIAAPTDIPSFHNSAMDGYAICWEEGDGERKLLEHTKLKAGNMEHFVLGKEEAVRIFTGAAIPKGADTVIPQEFVDLKEGKLIFDHQQFQKGANFRAQGAQNKKGDIIAYKHSMITPGMVGLLSSLGISKVRVFSPPKVGIILTGDELIEAGTPLSFGKVYNANGPVLRTYLSSMNIHNTKTVHAPDQEHLLQQQIDKLLGEVDVLIISGGISVGDYDYVKTCLEKADVSQLFYKVRQKPGKPLYVGKRGRQWIFALPGNPSSTLTCFNQYVKPCLLEWMGSKIAWTSNGYFPLADHFRKKQGLTFFLKAKIEKGEVQVLPGQESFNMIAFGNTNCFAEIPEEVAELEKGAMVNVYFW